MASNEASEQARDLVGRLLPSLRRFAWALTAGRERAGGDDVVRAAVEHFRPAAGQETFAKAELYGRVILANRRRQGGTAERPGRPKRTGQVAAEVERLPLDQREALLLVVLEGFAYDEAATILGIPRASVVARLLRARNTLAGGEKSPAIPHLRLVK